MFTYSGSVSAVKNGEKCLKVGAKTVTKGVTYECSKNAKGIKVWRSVRKSASTPTTVARGVTTTVARGVTTTVARGVTTTGSSGDQQGPVLVSGSVTPGSGDISTSSLTITVTVRITDASGVRYAPSGRIRGPASFSSFSTLTLISGDSRDGTYSTSFVIPQGRPAGNYYIEVSTPLDTIGNGSGSDGDFGSGPILITNVNSSTDQQGPVLVSGSVTPGSGDISTSSLTITVTVRITDASGVRYAPSGRIRGPASFSSFSTLTLISGDSRDGTYSTSFVIPQGRPAGNYYIEVSTPLDTIGNGSGSDGDFGSGPIPITSSP